MRSCLWLFIVTSPGPGSAERLSARKVDSNQRFWDGFRVWSDGGPLGSSECCRDLSRGLFERPDVFVRKIVLSMRR